VVPNYRRHGEHGEHGEHDELAACGQLGELGEFGECAYYRNLALERGWPALSLLCSCYLVAIWLRGVIFVLSLTKQTF
jgi:hypothetical protein